VQLFRITARLTEATFAPQTIYCQLRDWMGLPCMDLELWLRSNILPLDDRFSKSLDPIPRPQTILDNSSVQKWFEMAKHVDPPYCDDMKVTILRRSLGTEAGSFVPKQMKVSFPSLSSVKMWLFNSDFAFDRVSLVPFHRARKCHARCSEGGWRKTAIQLCRSRCRLRVRLP
jgi:hypothetical protein